MTSVIARFSRNFRTEFGQLPVWMPGTDMAVGDIGVIAADNSWSPLLRLRDLGVDFGVERGSTRMNYDHMAGRGVESRVGVGGSPTGPANVSRGNSGLELSFSEGAGFALQAQDCRTLRIDNIQALADEILRRRRLAQLWEKRWQVVVEVTEAQSYFLAVAQADGASITVDLGSVVPGTGLRVAASTSRVAVQNSAQAWLALNKGALMFRSIGVKTQVLGGHGIGRGLAYGTGLLTTESQEEVVETFTL